MLLCRHTGGVSNRHARTKSDRVWPRNAQYEQQLMDVIGLLCCVQMLESAHAVAPAKVAVVPKLIYLFVRTRNIGSRLRGAPGHTAVAYLDSGVTLGVRHEERNYQGKKLRHSRPCRYQRRICQVQPAQGDDPDDRGEPQASMPIVNARYRCQAEAARRDPGYPGTLTRSPGQGYRTRRVRADD